MRSGNGLCLILCDVGNIYQLFLSPKVAVQEVFLLSSSLFHKYGWFKKKKSRYFGSNKETEVFLDLSPEFPSGIYILSLNYH